MKIAELLKSGSYPQTFYINSSRKDFRGKRPFPAIQQAAGRARQYVSKIPSAVSGQHGHDQTFSVAVSLLHGFALPEAEAWPILMDYGARCRPVWSVSDLRHKLADAGKLTRHPKPRGHLLGSHGSIVVKSRSFFPPESLGRITLPEVLPAPERIPQAADPMDKPCDESPVYAVPQQPTVPEGLCPVCWFQWARALRSGSCVCTGDVRLGGRIQF